MADPRVESYLLAGFKSGWAAAFLTLAAECERQGDKAFAASLRQHANHPPPIECADLSTEKGRAMKAADTHEVVWMDSAPVKPGGAT